MPRHSCFTGKIGGLGANSGSSAKPRRTLSPAWAGVLSATDVQRIRDHDQIVVPAEQEMSILRDLEARIDRLIARDEGDGEAIGDDCADLRSVVQDSPALGDAGPARRVQTFFRDSLTDDAEWREQDEARREEGGGPELVQIDPAAAQEAEADPVIDRERDHAGDGQHGQGMKRHGG